MTHGICTLSIVPCRTEASDRAEMVTQLLFGETFEILDAQDKWTKVKIDADNYECWVDNKQITTLSEAEHKRLHSLVPFRSTNFMSSVISGKGELHLPIGSLLPGLKDSQFEIAGIQYQFDGMVVDTSLERSHTIPTIAKLLLNTPYLWGGRSPFGIDCSGFTQVVFSLAGIKLPRDAWQQAELGERITVEDAQPCDLAFFHNDKRKITHVGIVLEDQKIIHASGKVRIDDLSEKGIRIKDGSISHQLAYFRRN